ncbi:hypothetical protein MCEMIEM13_01531 [Comamonadaceae bacterium]
MNGLTIIKPLTITPAMVVATDVPEADYVAYVAGTTYALGDRVIYDHGIYQSLAASNVGNTPSTTPAKWVFVSATNRFKLFDLVNSSQTAKSSTMSYTVRTGTVVTAIGAVNLTSVFSIRIRVISDAYGSVYDETFDRTRRPPGSGWWNWFYSRRSEALASYYVDLPSFADAQIIVDFTGLADMAVGTLILGQVSRWGVGLAAGVSLGIRDYSRKETNEFGDVVLTRRKYANKAQFPLILNAGEVDSLHRYLASIRAMPCLWIGSGTYDSATVYGYYQDFEILISYPTVADCNLTIEGLA